MQNMTTLFDLGFRQNGQPLSFTDSHFFRQWLSLDNCFKVSGYVVMTSTGGLVIQISVCLYIKLDLSGMQERRLERQYMDMHEDVCM